MERADGLLTVPQTNARPVTETGRAQYGERVCGGLVRCAHFYLFMRRRRAAARPAMPSPSRAMDEGSGTGTKSKLVLTA
jgi:hypothetical protein